MLGKFCYTSKQSTEERCQQQFSNSLPRLLHKLHPLRMACGQTTAWMSQLLWDTSYSKLKIKIILFVFESFQGHQHGILNSSIPHPKHILSCFVTHDCMLDIIFPNKGDAHLGSHWVQWPHPWKCLQEDVHELTHKLQFKSDRQAPSLWFTGQFITCTIPPLFSHFHVCFKAGTAELWRTGLEAPVRDQTPVVHPHWSCLTLSET